MLRHSKQEQQMCRKTPGTYLGYVCDQHDGRCIICDMQYDEVLPSMREVHVCNDCGISKEGDERCVMCNSGKATEVAYYCYQCVALEKDRDGCPRVLNQTRHQRMGTARARSCFLHSGHPSMRRLHRCVALTGCVFPNAAVRDLSTTRSLLGLEQIQDVPTSTSRRPTGLHRGPGKRQTTKKEAAQYQFIRRWELQMREGWDELEPFKGLPKPKRQFGNEAAEVIWPYALLLERVVKVHPFTKSIYVYYSQRQSTPLGHLAAETAKAFAREFLIPITFHNSHVYVETEMLLEYSETPWVVVHSLDGEQKRILPVCPVEGTPVDEAVAQLLGDVVKTCEALGAAVSNPKEVTWILNERPLQNQYVRVDYQWFGDTPDERSSHLVKWDFDTEQVEPVMRDRTRHVLDWLNYDGNLPNHNSVRINLFREKSRLRSPRTVGGPKTFYNSSGSRANARTSRFGGRAALGS